jgi:hypothetical protein
LEADISTDYPGKKMYATKGIPDIGFPDISNTGHKFPDTCFHDLSNTGHRLPQTWTTPDIGSRTLATRDIGFPRHRQLRT